MKDIDKKMTLDEAIQHCHEVAESCENKECALNHEQLANWLEELKCQQYCDSHKPNTPKYEDFIAGFGMAYLKYKNT